MNGHVNGAAGRSPDAPIGETFERRHGELAKCDTAVMGFFDAIKSGSSLTPTDLTSDEYYTVRDTAPMRRMLNSFAKKQGCSMPDRPGAEFGHRVTVELRPNVLNRKTKPVPIMVTLGKYPVDELTGDRAAFLQRQFTRDGSDYGTADAFLYRGASGDWRLRIMLALPDD